MIDGKSFSLEQKVFSLEQKVISLEQKVISLEQKRILIEVKAPKVAETWCPDCRGGQKSGGFLVSATLTHQK